ncbi:MAG: PIN domain-containing protein [Oligoflexia bacterium]|nr:PIN domain-containing protein [Oligoflexia bacterium]
MDLYFLDTNATIWLYQGELEYFDKQILTIMEKHDLYISPMVTLELQYLYEIDRIKKSGDKIVSELYKSIGLQVHNIPLTVLIEKALTEEWTRDPFDRLITTHAKLEDAYLITKDKTILKNYKRAIW